MTNEAPRRISDRVVPVSITGYFMPTLASNAPVLIGMLGTDDLFIVVFSTKEKLTGVMQTLGIKFKYKHVSIVTNGRDLINEIRAKNATSGRPYRIRLAVDPYKAANGHIRFTEVLLSKEVS